MCRVFDVFLVWILTLFLQIQGGGGRCSPIKQAECEAIWRTCSNERCGSCFESFIEFRGECYNPAQDDAVERLENCDPNVDSDCKRNLGDISDQLLIQLDSNDNKVVSKDSDSLKLTKSKNEDISDSSLQTGAEEETPSKKLSQDLSNKLEKQSSQSELTPEKASILSKKPPVEKDDESDTDDIPDVYFLIIIIACTLSGVAGIALSGYCWYKLHHNDDKMKKNDYIPGIKKQDSKSTPSKNGDRKLDYKAEMYHYVHTKNQIAAMEKAKSDQLSSGVISNDEDDDDGVEDYTVYECPGLAPTGDMTVVNPLFSDQEISVSDEGRAQSNHSSPGSPSRSNHSPSR